MDVRPPSLPPGSLAPGVSFAPLAPGPASRLGLGTHGLHRLLSAGRRQSLLRQAFELGIRYFDTAPSYGSGLAEREIGRFAAGRRSDLVITTKFGIPVSRAISRVPALLYAARTAGVIARKLGAASRAARDYSAAHAQASLEQSLRALRTSYVDVLYLHEPQQLSLLGNVEPLLSMLESLKAAGKVRHIGLSGSSEACSSIAQAHPALAQVLQIEVPADPQGLPRLTAVTASASVRFWEFPPADPAQPFPAVLQRLGQAAPQGLLLLSTHHAQQLREAASVLLQSPPHARDGAHGDEDRPVANCR